MDDASPAGGERTRSNRGDVRGHAAAADGRVIIYYDAIRATAGSGHLSTELREMLLPLVMNIDAFRARMRRWTGCHLFVSFAAFMIATARVVLPAASPPSAPLNLAVSFGTLICLIMIVPCFVHCKKAIGPFLTAPWFMSQPARKFALQFRSAIIVCLVMAFWSGMVPTMILMGRWSDLTSTLQRGLVASMMALLVLSTFVAAWCLFSVSRIGGHWFLLYDLVDELERARHIAFMLNVGLSADVTAGAGAEDVRGADAHEGRGAAAVLPHGIAVNLPAGAAPLVVVGVVAPAASMRRHESSHAVAASTSAVVAAGALVGTVVDAGLRATPRDAANAGIGRGAAPFLYSSAEYVLGQDSADGSVAAVGGSANITAAERAAACPSHDEAVAFTAIGSEARRGHDDDASRCDSPPSVGCVRVQ